jgi:cell division protein FtsI (penicillin-binding protein 3)
MLVTATVRLSFIQGWNADNYASKALDQRSRTNTLSAERGTITDRNGTELAFTVEGRAIAARPGTPRTCSPNLCRVRAMCTWLGV